jgi:hypothetical protein
LETVLARIEMLQGRPMVASAPPPAAAPATTNSPAGPPGQPATPFAQQLQSVIGAGAAPAGSGAGARALAAAQAELAAGVTEQPPGSNDGPRIAEYRSAVPGGPVGPWCAYFASWAARQAGAPIGEQGQGYAAVAQVWAWGQRTGRAIPAGGRPQPGDLVIWGSRHMGMVESVKPDGSITTIEGNSSDSVARREYGPDAGGATGYVRLG